MARKQLNESRGTEAPLDARLVVEAAVRFVQRHGIAKLSMRGLARELGVSPMAIYHHVPSKEALLAQIEASLSALVPSLAARSKASSVLSEQQIIAAALQLLRSRGADDLSMRGLARELGVSVMALYHYVQSKEELLDKLHDAVLDQVPTPPVTGENWEQQMRAYALNGVLLLSEYPGLLRFVAQRPPTRADRRLTHHGIAILLAAGCEARTAALAVKTYHTHIFGLVIAQRVSEPAAAVGGAQTAESTSTPESEVAQVVRQLREIGLRESVEFGIDTVLHGLRVQIAAAQARRKVEGAPLRSQKHRTR